MSSRYQQNKILSVFVMLPSLRPQYNSRCGHITLLPNNYSPSHPLTNLSIHFLTLQGSEFTVLNFDLADVFGRPTETLMHCALKGRSHSSNAVSQSWFVRYHTNRLQTATSRTLADCWQFVIATINVYLSLALEPWCHILFRGLVRNSFVKNKDDVTVPLDCKGTGSRNLAHCTREMKGHVGEQSTEKPRTDHSLTKIRLFLVHLNTVVWIFIHMIKFVNFS